MILLFWISLSIIFYTYIGYGILIYFFVRIKRFLPEKFESTDPREFQMPSCSVVIAAYNEEAFIRKKLLNTLSLNYPPKELKIYIVTDGSTDNTTDIVREYPQIILLHSPKRRGKVHAINRVMESIDSEVVVFTDANTFLNQDALIKICSHYVHPQIGGVAGEKRIFIGRAADASTAGESIY